MTREPGELEALDEVERIDGLDELGTFDGLDEVEGETVVVDRGARESQHVDEVGGETVVVDRGARGSQPDDEVEGETVVVDRGAREPAHSDEVDGETVVVDRGRPRTDAPADADGIDFAAAETMVSGPRSPGAVDGSVEADGSGDDSAADTIVVARGHDGAASDRRSAADGPLPEASVTADAPVRRRRLGGRRTLEPAPLEPIDLRSSVRAVGAGAVEYYRPRQLPPATPMPETFDAAPPTREPSPGLPSIRRSSRRVAVTTLVALTASIAVGLAGAFVVAGLLLNA
jgi:hypothetical protein